MKLSGLILRQYLDSEPAELLWTRARGFFLDSPCVVRYRIILYLKAGFVYLYEEDACSLFVLTLCPPG